MPRQLLNTRYDRAEFASGVAGALIAIGVRCVVAAGWAVDDDARHGLRRGVLPARCFEAIASSSRSARRAQRRASGART